MRVHVYWNLGKELFCIKQEDGQVVEYARSVHLVNCDFKIDQPKQYRTRSTGRKNEHAWVEGFMLDYSREGTFVAPAGREARYDPFENDTFVDKETGLPIKFARVVVLQDKRIFCT
jgi:hypothetical protein